ncbi:MAG: NYN domain-containing protein [Candidatus Omnitrophota bacterium]
MSLHYIIDGYNIINHPQFTRTHKSSQDSRTSLLSLIRRKKLTGSLKNEVTVVFDGYPDLRMAPFDESGIRVIFSRKVSADEKIKMLVEETANRKNIIAVSDDKEIKFMVKSLRAQVLGVDEFFSVKEKAKNVRKEEMIEAGLNYTQMQKINEELSRLWLKE